MDPASFAISVVALVDTCVKLFKYLSKSFKAFQDAVREIGEAMDVLDHYIIRIETQLQLLKMNWAAFGLPYRNNQLRLLKALETKLGEAVMELERVSPGPQPSSKNPIKTSKQLKYSLQVQSALQSLISDIERWVNLFDPSWFLHVRNFEMMQQVSGTLRAGEKANNPNPALDPVTMQVDALVDNQVDQPKSVFIPSKDLDKTAIALSQAYIIHQPSSDMILDAGRSEHQSDHDLVVNDVRRLAKALQKVDPSISGLLQCKGVIKTKLDHPSSLRYDFIFRIPPGLSHPKSLHDILLRAPTHPLNERVELARSIAHALAFVHNIQLVHKNISPATCLVFATKNKVLGTPFLIGFDNFRLAEGQTMRVGDDDWCRNLYRHPSRQGLDPHERYSMLHDIYSLGVVLLEIGLWTSFVTETREPSARFLTVADGSLTMTTTTSGDGRRVDATAAAAARLKSAFVDIAADLGPVLGSRYRDVVLTCLTCLDEDNGSFGSDEDDFQDEDGITVGVRYIEKVLMRLDQVVV